MLCSNMNSVRVSVKLSLMTFATSIARAGKAKRFLKVRGQEALDKPRKFRKFAVKTLADYRTAAQNNELGNFKSIEEQQN